VNVSLGSLLLVFTLLLGSAFAALLAGVQFRHLSLHRRHSAELRSHRELADNAEISRFTELRQYLQQELAEIKEAQRQSEQRLRDDMQATQNSLSASVGEIDERLERHFPSPPEHQP
jgi:biopolymer transport protein ExbB/TolQ